MNAIVAGAEPNVPRYTPVQSSQQKAPEPTVAVFTKFASPPPPSRAAQMSRVTSPWASAGGGREPIAEPAAAEGRAARPCAEPPGAEATGTTRTLEATPPPASPPPCVAESCKFSPEEQEKLLNLRSLLLRCSGELEGLRGFLHADGGAACGLPRLKEAHRSRLQGRSYSVEDAQGDFFGGHQLLSQLQRYVAFVDGALADDLAEQEDSGDEAEAAVGGTASLVKAKTEALEGAHRLSISSTKGSSPKGPSKMARRSTTDALAGLAGVAPTTRSTTRR